MAGYVTLVGSKRLIYAKQMGGQFQAPENWNHVLPKRRFPFN